MTTEFLVHHRFSVNTVLLMMLTLQSIFPRSSNNKNNHGKRGERNKRWPYYSVWFKFFEWCDLSVCPFGLPYIYLSITIYPSDHLTTQPSTHHPPTTNTPTHTRIHPSIYVWLSVLPSVCTSIGCTDCCFSYFSSTCFLNSTRLLCLSKINCLTTNVKTIEG